MRTVFVTTAMLIIGAAAAADWPGFLGPDRNGVCSQPTSLATTWPAEGPKKLWSAKVGPGWCGTAIVGQEVFLLDHDDSQDMLRCLSLADGQELWRYAYDAPGKINQNGSRSTPAVDDKYVFTVGPFGDFHCIDRKTHQPVWRKNLVKDFSTQRPDYAVAQSALLYKDLVIAAPCGKEAGIVAFKKDTGEIAWQSEPCGSQQYMSATPMTIDGVEQILAFGNARRSTVLLSVEPATGKTLWKFDKWYCDTPIASPVHAGGGKVFLSGGYSAGSIMIQVKKQDEQWSAETLWKLTAKQCGSQIHNPLVWNDFLFVDNNENGRTGGMVCVGVDGKVAWSSTQPSCRLGGQIIANGLMYKVDGNRGMLYLVEPSAESFKVLARAKVLSGDELWAPLAISDGRLLLRDQSHLVCLDVR